jgi:hypothetical protein
MSKITSDKIRNFSVHLLIQEEAEDMDKREIFTAVPSLATINFASGGKTPEEVQNALRALLESMDFRDNSIKWAQHK